MEDRNQICHPQRNRVVENQNSANVSSDEPAKKKSDDGIEFSTAYMYCGR
jgi:hypothetical protein